MCCCIKPKDILNAAAAADRLEVLAILGGKDSVTSVKHSLRLNCSLTVFHLVSGHLP